LGKGDSSSGDLKIAMSLMVFITSFGIIVGLLVTGLSPILYNTPQEQADPIPGFNANELMGYTLFPTGLSGNPTYYTVVPAMNANSITIPSDSLGGYTSPAVSGGWNNMTFNNDGTTIRAYLVEDVGWVFWCSGGWWNSYSDTIKDTDITKNMGVDSVSATVHVALGGKSYTALYAFDDSTPVASQLANHTGYTVALGQSQMDTAVGTQADVWSYFTGIITFNMPNGGSGVWILDTLISTVFVTALGFLTIWMIIKIVGAFNPL
jgi:hypothetical protein